MGADRLAAAAERPTGATDGAQRAAAELLRVAELELELATAGRGDELADVHARRDAAIALLPDELSPAVQDALRLALGLQRQAATVLAAGLTERGRELAATARGRTAARGYAPTGGDPRRVLDRTA